MTQRRIFIAALGALPLVSVGGSWAQTGSASPMMNMGAAAAGELAAVDALATGAPWRDLAKLANASGQTGLYRASLTAAPVKLPLLAGAPTEFWAYNGSLPGPLMEVTEGDTAEIDFENRLPQATTVHWHGLPVPAEQDGNPHDPVAPGDKRLYRFTLPLDLQWSLSGVNFN